MTNWRVIYRTDIQDGWLVQNIESVVAECGVLPYENFTEMTNTLFGQMTSALVAEKKSTHKAEVVPVVLERHPNADALSVVKVYGYTCCARTDAWEGVDRAVYIVPDSLVDVTRPEFAFLALDANADGKARVKVRKMRGVMSWGLLVPAPAGAQIGDDLAEQLGVERYEPPEPGESEKEKFFSGGANEEGPPIETGPSHYDVDAFEVYSKLFQEGEPVVISEKLDGSNARFVYWAGRFWVKSRKHWVKRIPDYSHITLGSLTEKGVPEERAKEIVAQVAARKPAVNGFWQALERTPALQKFLMENPGITVFGEVYGSTNRLKYGFPDGNRFAGFDIFRGGRFVDATEAIAIAARNALPWAPSMGLPDESNYGGGETSGVTVPYSFDLVKSLSEGKTTSPGANPKTIREGVVVRPAAERWDRRLGRVVMKCVNPDFLAGK